MLEERLVGSSGPCGPLVVNCVDSRQVEWRSCGRQNRRGRWLLATASSQQGKQKDLRSSIHLFNHNKKDYGWRDAYNPLRGLSMPKLVSLLERRL